MEGGTLQSKHQTINFLPVARKLLLLFAP
jgi:hypothetical protein